MNSAETELAWMAGFVDGEGYIGIYKHKEPRMAEGFLFKTQFCVVNTNIDALKSFKEHFGGGIYPQAKRNPNHKQGYQWKVTNVRALLALERLLPYLRIKARQAQLVIEAQTIISARDNKNFTKGIKGATVLPYPKRLYEIYEELRDLNRKGYWPTAKLGVH